MDEARLAKEAKTIQQLLSKYSHESGAQAPELILLDQFVQIDGQELKHEAEVLAMYESILQPHYVMVIILVHAAIELGCNQHFIHSYAIRMMQYLPDQGRKPPSYSD